MKQSANALLESGANRNRRMKMKQMKTYIIIAGVNGTGKSSLTGVLKNQLTDLGLIIDVDKLAEANNGDNIRAGRIAVQRIRIGISRGCVLPRKQPFPAP